MHSADSRFTFEQISTLAQGRERHNLEFKNSCFLVLGHPGNKKRKVTNNAELIDKLRETLASECGAFANSGGGTLIFGLNDKDGSPDSTRIPRMHGNTKIEDWIASILRPALQPALETFECYCLSSQDINLVVVNVSESKKAPHQSLQDRKYYVRQEKSAVPAEHWLIEAIRNKQKAPQLEIDKCSEIPTLSAIQSDKSAIIHIPTIIRNVGNLMAKYWAIQLIANDFDEVSLTDNAFIYMESKNPDETSSYSVRAQEPLFPGQAIIFRIRALASADYDVYQSMVTRLFIGGTNTPSLKIRIFADHASPSESSITIDCNRLFSSAYKCLADSRLIKTWGNTYGLDQFQR